MGGTFAPVLLRTVLALAAGVSLAVAFEPVAAAFLVPFSVAGYVLTTRGLPATRAWLPGLAFGVGFYFVHIWWMRAVGAEKAGNRDEPISEQTRRHEGQRSKERAFGCARLRFRSGAWLSGRAFASHARGRWFDSTRAHHFPVYSTSNSTAGGGTPLVPFAGDRLAPFAGDRRFTRQR